MTPELSEILADLGITVVPSTVYRRECQTFAASTMQSLLDKFGAEHLILTLRSIVETENNGRELVAPTIWAISDILLAHPEWPASGLKWLEALDSVDLAGLRELAKENRRAV